MVDNVPRSLEPSDAERLATLRATMTHGGAGGISRAVGPVLDRGLVRAIAGDLLGDDSLEASDSKIDPFTVTDDVTSTFQLTFDPITDSENVKLGWPLEKGTDYTISGRTLTIVDPVDLFRGIADNGPRVLHIQYDYLTGVPISPNQYFEPTVVGVPWFSQFLGASDFVECWWRMEGMDGIDVATDLGAQFHDPVNLYQGSTFGNLTTGPQLAGGSYAANIYYGQLNRPWYDSIAVDGLQIKVPWDGATIFDLPEPVSVNAGAPPTSYQG